VTEPDLTLIRAGRLVDTVAGEVRRAQVVHVRGDRIEAVTPDEGRYADAAQVIDLSQHTVLPGLIDCHAHLIGEVETGHGYASLVQRTAAQEALTGVRNARMTLMAGFTSVRDV
jgi:imidazolonepropionase-like amidohydrolase